MSDHDEDIRGLLREVAARAKPSLGAETRLLKEARRRRRMTAAAGAMAVLVLVGGLAGAATLVGDDGGIKPAPGPEETKMDRCEPPGHDLIVFVPEGATKQQAAQIGEVIRAHEIVTSAEFVTAEQAEREFRAENRDHEGALSTTEKVDQYRVDLEPGVDLRRDRERIRELANIGQGASGPALGCPPKEPEKDFARYFFEVAKGKASASGVIEVNYEDSTLCLQLTSENIMASHLLMDDPDHPRGRSIVLTFFDPNDDDEVGAQLPVNGPHCFHEEQLGFGLEPLLDQPELFAIDFHRGPNDEPGLVAELQNRPKSRDQKDGDAGWTRLSQPPIETQGYMFSNLSIRLKADDDDPGGRNAALRGRIGFDDGFPGKRMCRFSLHDSDGKVLGAAVSEFMAAGASSGIIKDTIPVKGTPAFTEIECSEKRLDDPNGLFSFRRVTVERDIGRSFMASSSFVSWEGDGDPTPQRCLISVMDSDGELLFKARSGYIAAGRVPRVVEFRFTAPKWAVDQVADATVDCRSIR